MYRQIMLKKKREQEDKKLKEQRAEQRRVEFAKNNFLSPKTAARQSRESLKAILKSANSQSSREGLESMRISL